MSVYRTEKTICVRYSSPVADCVRRLVVFPPMVRSAQHVLDLHWKCSPQADESIETTDEFGNRVLELRHRRIARELYFQMSLQVERDNLSVARNENLPPTGIGAFLLPSALCDRGATVQNAAQQFKETNALRLCEQLCDWTHHQIEYSIGATNIETTASQSLARRRGVCQDYAHVLIALCRAANVPARYISGYNVSEGAMHAWIEALCDGVWLAFDPTHNRRTRDDCTFVACGRDFRDASPNRASFRGDARVQMETRCVTTCETPNEPAA